MSNERFFPVRRPAQPFGSHLRATGMGKWWVAASLAAAGCGPANAVTAYAGAFNGPAGVFGNEQFGALSASASYYFDGGSRSMYARAAAEPGLLHATATASNTDGGFQFATAVTNSNESFHLAPPDGVNEAVLVWVLRLEGTCAAAPGATNGRPNATCGVQLALDAGTPWALSLDHAGEVSKTATVTIRNGFGFLNAFPIAPSLQAGGYATNGSFAADFENTAKVFVYSTTPGVTLVTESGHDYSLPVPEPTTPSLCFLSMGLFASWRALRRLRTA